MNYKKIIKIALISFITVGASYAVYKELNIKKIEEKKELAGIETKTSEILNAYVVYYFHTSARCYSCKLIENYTLDAINDNYKNELENKTLVWKAVNVDDAKNKYYIDLFKLYSKSIVLAKYENANLEKFNNLEKVWQLLRDEKNFKDYIKTEINSFME